MSAAVAVRVALNGGGASQPVAASTFEAVLSPYEPSPAGGLVDDWVPPSSSSSGPSSAAPASNHHTGFDSSMLSSLPPLDPPSRKKTQVASRKKPLDPALVAHSKSLNKDYLMLAQEYTNQSAYRCVNYTMRSQAVRLALLTSLTPLPPPRVVPTTVSPPASASCVLCKTNDVASVFFPCGHRCCCDACRLKNNIGTPAVQGSWNFCPICCAEIKLTLKRDGTEEDRYWKWVQEVR